MGKAADYVCRTKIGAYFYEIRESRKLVLLIVSIALLLDNMLLTIVVPIIPEFLYQMRHANDNVTVHRVGVGRAGFMSHSPGLMASPSPSSRPPPVIMTSAPQSTADGAYWVRRKMTTTESPPPSLSPMEMEGMMYPDYPSLPSLPDDDDDSSKKKDDDDEDNDEEVYYYYSDQVDMTPAEQQATDLETAKRLKHEELVKENIEVGVMFASKAFVQLIANPFVGPLTNKIGYSVPMFCGFVIMFFSTLLFAFSRSYFILFVARAFQGVGSSCSSVAGMGMLAERYPDDKERGNAMAIALGGLALGVLIGPPFGGFMYQFVGKSAPFLVLAILALLDGGLQLLVLQPTVIKSDEEAPSLKALISDPYILVASGAITFANMGIAMLEPSLPIFMMDRMDAEKWQLGAAFLPASISYLIGTNLFGPLGHRMGRWLASLLGLCLIGSALILVPFADRPNHLIIPMAGLGFGIGMVDSSMMPELGNLVDIRHSAVYGGVYAIGDIAFCMGFAVGPALSGSLVEGIGFKAMMIGVGIIGICYAPFLVFLHDPPHRTEEEKEESAKIMYGGDKTKVRYNNFDEELVGQPFLNSSGEKTNLGGHGVQGKGI